MYLEGNFVIPTGIWFVPEDMPFFKEMAKGDIRDISSLSKGIMGKMGMGKKSSHQNSSWKPSWGKPRPCFLTQAGLLPYPSIFSFSLDMKGWHQLPGKLQKWKSCQHFPWLLQLNMNYNQNHSMQPLQMLWLKMQHGESAVVLQP